VVECRACVSTVHPRYLVDMVPAPLFRAAYRARLKAPAETLSAFVAYALCDATPDELRGRNLVVVPSPGQISARDDSPAGSQLLYVAGVAHGCDGPNGTGGFVAIARRLSPRSPAGQTRLPADARRSMWRSKSRSC